MIDTQLRLRSLGRAVYNRVHAPVGKGDQGDDVKSLQRALVRWMPSWRAMTSCVPLCTPGRVQAGSVWRIAQVSRSNNRT